MSRAAGKDKQYRASWIAKVGVAHVRRLARESAARKRQNPAYREKMRRYMSDYCKTPEYRARRLARAFASWKHHLFLKLRYGAKKRGIVFAIDEADIPWNSVCPVLGIPIAPNFGGGHPAENSVSVDRIDNTLGYVPGNLVVVSYRANRIKNDATLDELRKVLTFYAGRPKDVS